MERWVNISNGRCSLLISGTSTRLQQRLATNLEQMMLPIKLQTIK